MIVQKKKKKKFNIRHLSWRRDCLLTVSLVRSIPAFRVADVALAQEHVSPPRGAAVGLQLPDRLRQAVLTLARAEILHALRHRTGAAGPSCPVRLVGPITRPHVAEDRVALGRFIRIEPKQSYITRNIMILVY